jgi:hypothetical protein
VGVVEGQAKSESSIIDLAGAKGAPVCRGVVELHTPPKRAMMLTVTYYDTQRVGMTLDKCFPAEPSATKSATPTRADTSPRTV